LLGTGRADSRARRPKKPPTAALINMGPAIDGTESATICCGK
jgi:hypothetical protein